MNAQFEVTNILQTEALGDTAKHVRLEASSDERAALAGCGGTVAENAHVLVFFNISEHADGERGGPASI